MRNPQQGELHLKAPQKGGLHLRAPQKGGLHLKAPQEGGLHLKAPQKGGLHLRAPQEGGLHLKAPQEGGLHLHGAPWWLRRPQGAEAAEGEGVDHQVWIAWRPGGVCKCPRGAGLGGAGGWWVGVWRVGSGGWWGVVPPFALQRASKPPGRLLNLLCEAPCPHHLFVFRFCCVGLGGLVGGRPGFRGGSAARASPRLHFDP